MLGMHAHSQCSQERACGMSLWRKAEARARVDRLAKIAS